MMLLLSEDFAYAIRMLSNLSFLIPLIIFVVTRSQQTKSLAANLLFILFVISGSIDLATFSIKISREQSAILTNCYTIIEFLLLCGVYYQMFMKDLKVFFYTSVLAFVLFEILSTIFLQPFNTFQNFSIAIESIFFILFAIGWKLHVFMTTPVLKISRYSYFWINTAVLCYFSVNLFLFILTNYVFANVIENLSRIFWSFHNFNNIIKNLLFAIGLYYSSPKFMFGNRFNPA